MTQAAWGAIFLVAFVLLLVVISIRAARRTSGIDDFAVGGRQISPVALGICTAATAHSIGTFLGNGGFGFAFGTSILWHALILPFPFALSVMAFGKLAARFADSRGSVSLPDWLGHRYESDALRVSVALVSLTMVVAVFAQFAGAATALEAVLGIPYQWALTSSIVLVIGYTMIGGTYADVYTDVVQAMLMAVVAVVLAGSAFWVFDDGLSTVQSSLARQDPALTATFNPANPLFGSIGAILAATVCMVWYAAEPQHFNKVLGLAREGQLRRYVVVLVISMVVLSLPDFGGIYRRALTDVLPVSADFRPDMANLDYLELILPGAFSALAQVAILGAAMSTMDGLLISLSTAVSNDIYRRVLVPKGLGGLPMDASAEMIQRRTLRVAQGTMLILGLLALGFAAVPPEFLGILLLAGRGALGAAAAAPLFLGLFWRRATARGALTSVLLGGFSYIGIYAIFEIERNPLIAQVWGMAIGTIGMICVSLMDQKSADNRGISTP